MTCVVLNFPSHVLPGFLSPTVASGNHTNENQDEIAEQIRKLNKFGQRSKQDCL